MDTRLVALGASIIASATILGLYGWVSSSSQALGVAFSLAVLGFTVLVMGASHQEPLSEALQDYSTMLGKTLLGIYEDLGLVGAGIVQGCVQGDTVYLVFSRKPLGCDNIAPGVGVEKGISYIAVAAGPREEVPGLEELATRLGLARTVLVEEEGASVVVEVVQPSQALLGGEWAPLNPVQLLVLASATARYGRIVVEGQEYLGDLYRVRLRVGEKWS